MINFSEQLKNKGIKITPHKLAILDVLNRYKHIDAVQISLSLKSESINISTATIYRILASLEKHNIVNKLNFGNEQSIYELNNNSDHHDHLICIKCGDVVEFKDSEIEELQDMIAAKNNFKVINHTLNIYGTCHKCSNL